MIARLILAVLMFAIAAPLQAADFSAEEKAVLGKRLAIIETAGRTGDPKLAVLVTPPELMAAMVESTGQPQEVIEAMLVSLTAESSKDVVKREFTLDFANARYQTTPAGNCYALIPNYSMEVDKGGERIEIDAYLIAFVRNGDWRIIGIPDKASLPKLVALYPELDGAEMPLAISSKTE